LGEKEAVDLVGWKVREEVVTDEESEEEILETVGRSNCCWSELGTDWMFLGFWVFKITSVELFGLKRKVSKTITSTILSFISFKNQSIQKQSLTFHIHI
jgi:hypothetical protein